MRSGSRRERTGPGPPVPTATRPDGPAERSAFTRLGRFRLRAALALVAVAALAPAAHAAKPAPPTYGFTVTAPTTPLTTTPAAAAEAARLTGTEAEKIFVRFPKVADWLSRYPKHPSLDASFSKGTWTVNVFSGRAGEIATGTVDDATGAVLTAYTGPQVAWGMARGGPGAFGGRKINSYPVWLGFCAAFLIGLVDWRRLLSLRNLDLVMMLSFSVSLWYFNRGDIFTAMPLAYPGMAWLLVRCLWIGRRDRAPRGTTVWPVWVLIGATVFLAGFRIGLNVRDSNVIDVGLSGVIGAQRIASFQNPYGNFPIEGDRPACGPADANGEIRDRIQTNGRCEAADAQGDTYGPVSYEAYLPGYLAFGWSGKWDTLPAAHATSILWDLLCIAGLFLVGWRFGGARLAATLAFAWTAWPFSQYASSSNTNDMIQPAILVFGFYFLGRPALRGAFGAWGALVKFAPLLVLPLWSGYPDSRDRQLTAALRHRCSRRLGRGVRRSAVRLVPAARSGGVLPPHVRLPVRACLAVLALGLAAVPREGASRPPLDPAGAPGGARGGSGRRSTAGRGIARRSRWPRSRVRFSSASRWC